MKKSSTFIKLTILFLVCIYTSSCGQNKPKLSSKYNKLLAEQLDSILTEDQKYRHMIASVEEKYGIESKENKELWKTIAAKDSINIIKVKSVLDKYGWPGTDEVGENGNSCLFLVIQHSDQKTREKYLPLMREAVKQGKAQGRNLALLEDRVALGQGKKQIYGSQVYRDEVTGKFYFAPIEDERNVNKRRMALGLGKLENYAGEFGFEYKMPVK
ncbi:MAG: DUF6624 domain-containing protein [Daejeonella sp.]